MEKNSILAVNIKIPESEQLRIKIYCIKKDVKIRDFVRLAVENYIEKVENSGE